MNTLSKAVSQAATVAVLAWEGAALAAAPQTDAVTRAPVSEAYYRLPLAFEVNRGQTDRRVQFLSRGIGYTLFLTPTEAVLSLTQPAAAAPEVVRMKILGANEKVHIAGVGEQPGKSHYFAGADPTAWHTEVPRYGAVRYESVYPDVDLVFHGSNQGQLEYDFVVGPGADPAIIRLGFEGATRLSLDDTGNLVLRTPGGDLIERAPVAYQEIGGARRRVDARYEITGEHEIAFHVAAYDRTRALIIDPVLAYSTYLGGNGGQESGVGIAVDGSGSAYVVGGTSSADFPTSNPLQGTMAGPNDVIVAKFSPSGSALVYSTFLGGSSFSGDGGSAIAVDGSGSAYVAGRTCSTDFPTVIAVQAAQAGGCDAFVAKLSAAGNALVYSTYLGGSGSDFATGVAVDSSGSAYVTGTTFSTNFPTVNAVQAVTGSAPSNSDGFVAKLSPAGSALAYSTYLGGGGLDAANAIAVDASGGAYVTGTTFSANFPTANALFGSNAGNQDAFVTKLAPAGNALAYSTYLGGLAADAGNGIAVEASGSAHVTGIAFSTNFPVVNALQGSKAGGFDAFLTRLSPAGNSLVYSTYLGGTGEDRGRGIALDAAGNAYVTGWTASTDFPTVNAVQASHAGGLFDLFVTKISAAGNSLVYSTYVGGSGNDFVGTGGNGIAVDAAGSAYVTDTTFSTNFPTVNAFQTVDAGSARAVVFKIESDPPPPVNQPPEAHAGDDRTVQTGTQVTLQGGDSFDPDADALTYTWTQTAGPAVVLSDPAAATTTFTAPPVGSAGATVVFVLTVDDGVAQSTDEVQIFVTDVNQVPIAEAGSDQTADEGTVVTLQGLASSDPDGDALTYVWRQLSGPHVLLSDPHATTPAFTAPDIGSGGATLVFELVVSDGSAESEPDQVTVTVRDVGEPPSCDLAQANPGVLWPPNHHLVPVTVVGVADPEDRDVTITITSVTQDEPVNGLGDGDTSPDAVLRGAEVLLRAERSGKGTGRVYTVGFTAGADGAECAGSVTVCVPHDRRTNECIDDGQRYDSLLP